MRHINEPAPSVVTQRPDCPPRLAAAVARALAKEPQDRFPSMDAFATELEACLRELRPGAATSTETVVRRPARRPPRRRPRPRTQFTPGPALLALVALAALAVIVVAAVAVQRHSSVLPGIVAKGSSNNASNSSTVTVTATGTYDPQGGGGEHDSEVSNATDGNQTTYWTTEHYGNPEFGGLKDGVGLVLNVGGTAKSLTVTSDTPGFTAVVESGSSPETAKAVSDSEEVEGKTTFDLRDATGSVLVLWITHLPSTNVAHVDEVTAAS